MKQQITENKENLFFGIQIARMSVVTLKRRPQKIIQVQLGDTPTRGLGDVI